MTQMAADGGRVIFAIFVTKQSSRLRATAVLSEMYDIPRPPEYHGALTAESFHPGNDEQPSGRDPGGNETPRKVATDESVGKRYKNSIARN